jgi:hypothetical protein
MSKPKLKEHYIDWILEEQTKGHIHNVKWKTDEQGIHFSFSIGPEDINPTYRNHPDEDDDVRWSYAEIA